MAEVPISQDDIVGLAQTLDGLALPEAQKALLSAVVAVAAETIGELDPPLTVQADLEPSFEEQFATAFAPGAVDPDSPPDVDPDATKSSRFTKIKIGRNPEA